MGFAESRDPLDAGDAVRIGFVSVVPLGEEADPPSRSKSFDQTDLWQTSTGALLLCRVIEGGGIPDSPRDDSLVNDFDRNKGCTFDVGQAPA